VKIIERIKQMHMDHPLGFRIVDNLQRTGAGQKEVNAVR